MAHEIPAGCPYREMIQDALEDWIHGPAYLEHHLPGGSTVLEANGPLRINRVSTAEEIRKFIARDTEASCTGSCIGADDPCFIAAQAGMLFIRSYFAQVPRIE